MEVERTPTDNERREVARRIKSWEWKSAPPECLLNSLAFGDDCPGTEDDPNTIGCHECECMAANRLAELIEPEPERTCNNVACSPCAFRCSKCGWSDKDRCDFNYCPNCGAKVVDNG